tara:strand:+ start:3757 stop:4122 length:366 start_codon:yes stop_codon:yes gene_type:complete
MSNEFDYKKYLSNNPLLEGEVEENTFDPEVARGINSDVRKALDDFYENGDGSELASSIEDIMFGNYNEEITEASEEEFDELTTQAEKDYESGIEVKVIISKIPDEYKDKVEQHLRLKMGDY